MLQKVTDIVTFFLFKAQNTDEQKERRGKEKSSD